ncbi:MAG: pyruvate kinase [Pirellulales bacterium]|nr:pyruvate kinase [Pirellulales bacterium]
MKGCILALAGCLILVGGQSGCGDATSNDVADGGPENQARGPRGWDPQRKPLAAIRPGTNFAEQPPADWSHLILFANGRLGAGDVSEVAGGVDDYVKMFDIAVLANTERDKSGRHHLDKVGIGFTTKLDGRNTIVTLDSQAELGADLDMVARDVLSGHERGLAEIRQVARDATSIMVDVPTLMLHRGQHRTLIVRYLICVSPDSGQVDTFVWLLAEGESEPDCLLVEEDFQHLPPNAREDRILHVDGDRLTFGIPSDEAFAAVRIPRGTPHRFTEQMRRHAGRVRFTEEAYRELTRALSDATTPE